jgi:hypothetical protein
MMRHPFEYSTGLSWIARALAACVITATLFTVVAFGLTGTDGQGVLALAAETTAA